MPLVPVATQYTASATDLVEFDFVCAVCRARSRASVLTTTHGVAMGAPLGIGAAQEKALAAARALDGLSAEARALALLAKCHACGARDPEAVRRAWMWPVGFGLFRGGLIGALCSPFAILFGASPLALGAPLALALATLFAVLDVRKRFAKADRFVEFQSPPP